MALPATPNDRLEMPAALIHERGVVRLLEAAGTDPGWVAKQMLAGEYTRAFVVDDGRVKRLHLSLALIQSEMNKNEPWALHLAYTRAMMAFMLLLPRPRQITIVGLGGGSLTKYCHRHLPRSRLTTVELNPDVIAFRDEFEIPVDDERHRIVCADAAEHFATTGESSDVVLLDGYDDTGIAPSFANGHFYRSLAASLSPRGLLVCNLAQKNADSEEHLALLREEFGEVLILPVPEEGNRIAFALREAGPLPDPAALRRTARVLARQIDLPFELFAQRLARSR